jgi:hypothetical protein
MAITFHRAASALPRCSSMMCKENSVFVLITVSRKRKITKKGPFRNINLISLIIITEDSS